MQFAFFTQKAFRSTAIDFASSVGFDPHDAILCLVLPNLFLPTHLRNFYETFTKFLRNFYETFTKFLRRFSPRTFLSTQKNFLGVFQALWFFSMWNHLAHRKIRKGFCNHKIFDSPKKWVKPGPLLGSIQTFDAKRTKTELKISKCDFNDTVFCCADLQMKFLFKIIYIIYRFGKGPQTKTFIYYCNKSNNCKSQRLWNLKGDFNGMDRYFIYEMELKTGIYGVQSPKQI